MSKNIRHELRNEIMQQFKECQNKHEIKQEDRSRIGVWSYGTRNDLLDKCNVFCKFLNEQKITKEDQITKETVRNFLESKANEGCSGRTVDAYRSAISRIGELRGHDWHSDKVIASERTRSDRGAESVISKNDYEKILAYGRDNPSSSATCIALEREIGVRVGDLAYGVKEVGNNLEINSKNGRICVREITPEVRQIINSKEYRSMVDENGKLHAPKDGSINRYLNRVEDKLGIERHSFHDMRRCVAQEKYDSYRNSGLDRTESLNKVGGWLNHGEHRAVMVLESYIANAW